MATGAKDLEQALVALRGEGCMRVGVRFAGAISAWLIGLAGCSSPGVAGATCSTDSDCASDLTCLYPIGAGCSSQGSCTIPTPGCLAGTQDFILCGCNDAQVDTTCIHNSAALPQPTATGPACGYEAGPDSISE